MLVKNVGLVLDQPYYDTVSIAAAATSATFFQTPFGGTLVGTTLKDYSHTNLIQAGRLETNYVLEVDGISIHVKETATRATAADIRAIQTGSFIFTLSNTTILTLPIALIPNGGAELVLFSNIAPAATEYALNKGVSAHQNRYMLKYPVTIDPQQTFQVTLQNFGTIAAATQVTVVLWGKLTRPVVG